MSANFDVIVLGLGGVGSAALHQVARRGHRVLGIDQFAPPHDRGSTHGQTRIIRQAYFEHPDYVPLLFRAYELWREIEAATGQSLFEQVGLLEVGPADGIVVPGVLASAEQHHLAVEQLTAAEVEQRFPAFRVPEKFAAVFEPTAGFLHVERCVAAQLQLAAQAGAVLQLDTSVLDWSVSKTGVVVVTDRGEFRSDRLIIAAGPWATRMLPSLGVPLEVRRKPIYWFDVAQRNAQVSIATGCPTFLYELDNGVFYGFPAIDDRGVKVAQHSGGSAVVDPSTVDRSRDDADCKSVCQFAAAHLVGLMPQPREHATCLYTMSPDENFIVDTLPGEPRVAFAAGLSGHGYKFAPVLGEVLADLVESGHTRHPIEFLRVGRFGKRVL
jgi:sarcosine oxidase